MSNVSEQPLLEALLDSWDRNNTILVNLLHALPQGGLDARAMEGSPSIAELFTHIHYVRLVFVSEDAPELEPLDGTAVAYFHELMGSTDRTQLWEAAPESTDIASYLHTGGTTGVPKACYHTHRRYLQASESFRRATGIEAGEPSPTSLPPT